MGKKKKDNTVMNIIATILGGLCTGLIILILTQMYQKDSIDDEKCKVDYTVSKIEKEYYNRQLEKRIAEDEFLIFEGITFKKDDKIRYFEKKIDSIQILIIKQNKNGENTSGLIQELYNEQKLLNDYLDNLKKSIYIDPENIIDIQSKYKALQNKIKNEKVLCNSLNTKYEILKSKCK